jgi:preprotein translocase subunit SecE
MGRLQRKKTSGAKKKKKKKTGLGASVSDQAVMETPDKVTAPAMAGDKVISEAKTTTPRKKFPVAGGAAEKPKAPIFQSSIQFLREVKIELKKVTWPSRKQTIGSTVVVIALVLLISLFLGFVDIGLSSLMRAVLQ